MIWKKLENTRGSNLICNCIQLKFCLILFVEIRFFYSLTTGGAGGGAPSSPEMAKLQATVGELADKVDAVNEKVDGGGGGPLAPLAPGAKAGPLGGELAKMGSAIEKLAGEIAAMKEDAKSKEPGDIPGFKDDKSLKQATKILLALQKNQKPPLQQVCPLKLDYF